jgi:O-antigen ligase
MAAGITLLLVTGGVLVWQSAATARMLPILHGSPDPITVTPQGDPMAQVMARAAGVRGQIWFVSLSLISQRPVFGWGTKSWKVVAPPEFAHVSHAIDMKNPKTDVLARTPHAHNAFLQAWVEHGVVGVALLAWMLVSCWQVSRRVADHLLRAVLLGMLGVWLCDAMTEVLTNSVITMAYLGLIMVAASSQKSFLPQSDR